MSKKIIMKPKEEPVDVVIGCVYSKINGLHNTYIIDALDNCLSYHVSGYQFTKAFQTGWWDNRKKKWTKWDGKNHLLDRKDLRFLTGLLDKATSVLSNYGIKYNLIDSRKQVSYKKKIKTKNIESRPYQEHVLEACLKHQGGIVQAATGSGKSVMITQLIANTNVRTMVYVIGIDLLYQMRETFEYMLGTKVGIIGDGKAEIRKINVCTVWTAANALGNKYVPFDDEDWSKKEDFDDQNKEKIVKAIVDAELAIYDECQMLAAKTLQLINVNSESAIYKFGFSGTPYREDGADLLLEAVCGKVIIEVTASELIHDGYLVIPKIQFIDIPEYEGGLSKKYQTIYKEYIVENEVRNEKIAKIAVKLAEAGRPALILVKTIKHGEILLSMLPENLVVYFVRGSVNSDERNRIRQEFMDGKIDVIIASAVYDQGVNLPSLEALILAGSGKSRGRALQRIGRVIRTSKSTDKKDAIVIDFIDNAKYLLEHSYNRLDTYRKEPGFSIKLPKGKSNGKTKKKTKQLPEEEGW